MTASGYISVNGAQLYFEADGDPSNPTLLFIHAGVADRTMWEPQVAHFASRYHVVRYDTRGYGKTTMEDADFANHADAAAVLNHLGVDKAVVIGCSRGGGFAIDFTLEYPQHALALVTVASGPAGFPYEPVDSDLTRFINSTFEVMEAAWQARDFEKLAGLDVRLWGDGPSQPEGRMAAPLRQKMYAMCLDTYRAWTTDGKPIALKPPAYERLGEIKVPMLIVDSDFDLPAMPAMAEAMQRKVVQAQRVTIHDAAHLPSMERPDAFNAVLEDFLSQQGI